MLKEMLRNETKSSNEVRDNSFEKLKNQVNRGVVLERMPSSCRDLWTVGHSHTGYYFIASSNSKYPVELVYCDMKERRNNPTTPSVQLEGNLVDRLFPSSGRRVAIHLGTDKNCTLGTQCNFCD